MFNNNLSIAAMETETIRVVQDNKLNAQQTFQRFYEEGIFNLNRGNFQASIECFEEALKINPKNHAAQRYLIEAITANMTVKEASAECASESKNNVDSEANQKSIKFKKYFDKNGDQRPIKIKRSYKIPIPNPEAMSEAST